jgi:hypothetical protein
MERTMLRMSDTTSLAVALSSKLEMWLNRAAVTLEEIVEGLIIGACPRSRFYTITDLSASLTVVAKASSAGLAGVGSLILSVCALLSLTLF